MRFNITKPIYGVLFLASIILTACGGGGGGTGGSSSHLPGVAYSISGAVNGAILAGVTVNLAGAATASTTTDANGNYSFANQINGSYTVTVAKTGYTFSPTS